jgi:glutamate synthase (NADPH/NADH) large chain
MDIYKKNLDLLKKNNVYDEKMEHDACGVGLVVSTEGLKSRKVVEYGIQALKAVWHRGAIDADGKTGDGAGIHIEIPKDDFNGQEKCRTIIESELTKKNFNIYGWRQVPVNPSVLGEKAELTRPEIAQVLFTSNDKSINNKDLERSLYETRRKREKEALNSQLNNFYIC